MDWSGIFLQVYVPTYLGKMFSFTVFRLFVNFFPPFVPSLINTFCRTTPPHKLSLKSFSPVSNGKLFKKKKKKKERSSPYFTHVRKWIKTGFFNIFEMTKMGIECQEVSGMMKYIRIGMLSFQIHIYMHIYYIYIVEHR